LKPIKRKEFIRKLKILGFTGIYPGSKHDFLICGNHRLAIPSYKEYSIPQIKFLLKEVEKIIGRSLSETEWEDI